MGSITVAKTPEALQDWTAVAQNTIVHSAILDVSDLFQAELCLQAFLDTTTAHTGTKFIVQTSSAASGDEDWHDLTPFSALVGTAATDLIEDNPLAAAATSIALTGHALTVLGKWLAIEDGTLINSELVFESAQSANAVVILDGTTNEHALNTAVFNVAISKSPITLPAGTIRARVVVDNSYDADGSTLNYKVRVTPVQAYTTA